MVALVAGMQAEEAAGETPRPKGAHPEAVAEYRAHAREMQNEVPFTPKEAEAYWAAYERAHPAYVATPRTSYAAQKRAHREQEQESSAKL